MIYLVVGRIDVFHDALANRLLPWARDKARRFEKPGAAMRHQPILQDRRIDTARAEVADFRKSLPVRRHISNVKLDISAIAIVIDIRPEFRNLGKVLGCVLYPEAIERPEFVERRTLRPFDTSGLSEPFLNSALVFCDFGGLFLFPYTTLF